MDGHFLEIAEAVHEHLLCEVAHEGVLLFLCSFKGSYVLEDALENRYQIDGQMVERLFPELPQQVLVKLG